MKACQRHKIYIFNFCVYLDKTARLWWQETGMCLLQYHGHNGSVNSIRFHPTQDTVATSSGDQTTHIWKATVNIPSVDGAVSPYLS